MIPRFESYSGYSNTVEIRLNIGEEYRKYLYSPSEITEYLGITEDDIRGTLDDVKIYVKLFLGSIIIESTKSKISRDTELSIEVLNKLIEGRGR